MDRNNLFLRESDVRLEYRTQKRQLRYIYLKHNKLIELLGNNVLTEENISEKEKITLIKAGKTVEILLKENSGQFRNVKSRNRVGQERIVRFEVDTTVDMTESSLKEQFNPKTRKNPFFKQKIYLGVKNV